MIHRTASVGYVNVEKKRFFFTLETNVEILKEFKSRHDWVRKLINWELRKKREFSQADKWDMSKPESVIKMNCIQFSVIFRYKRTAKFLPEDQT